MSMGRTGYLPFRSLLRERVRLFPSCILVFLRAFRFLEFSDTSHPAGASCDSLPSFGRGAFQEASQKHRKEAIRIMGKRGVERKTSQRTHPQVPRQALL